MLIEAADSVGEKSNATGGGAHSVTPEPPRARERERERPTPGRRIWDRGEAWEGGRDEDDSQNNKRRTGVTPTRRRGNTSGGKQATFPDVALPR